MTTTPRTDLFWTVLADLGANAEHLRRNRTARLLSEPLVKACGAEPSLMWLPYRLRLATEFHQKVHARMRSREANFSPQKAPHPYKLIVADGIELSVTLNARYYPPSIVVFDIAISGIDKVVDFMDVPSIIKLEYFSSWPDLKELVEAALEVLLDSTSTNLPPLQAYPRLRMRDVSTLADAAAFFDMYVFGLVALLIRNPAYEDMSLEISQRIVRKNAEINLKSSKELFLLDRQGMVTARAEDAPNTGLDEEKLSFLAEVAFVDASFLQGFFSVQSNDPLAVDYALSRIRRWVLQPTAALPNSVSAQEAWRILAREFRLEERLAEVESVPEVKERQETLATVFSAFAFESPRASYWPADLRLLVEPFPLELAGMSASESQRLTAMWHEYLACKLGGHSLAAIILLRELLTIPSNGVDEELRSALIDQANSVIHGAGDDNLDAIASQAIARISESLRGARR